MTIEVISQDGTGFYCGRGFFVLLTSLNIKVGMAAMADALTKFDKVQKYLAELEERRGFEEPVNAVYSFNLIYIPNYGNIFTSLERHFEGTGYKLTITKKQEWQLSLYLDLDKYLKEGEIDFLIKILLEAFGNSTVKFWNLSIDENNGPFYDIFWDDYIFELEGELYLLHFGFSD